VYVADVAPAGSLSAKVPASVARMASTNDDVLGDGRVVRVTDTPVSPGPAKVSHHLVT